MADRPFESLVPRINPSVPGCPYATIVQHIRDVAIDACERTLVWRYQMPVFSLHSGVSEYSYVKPTIAEVHALLAALVNDSPLQVLNLEQAVRAYPKVFSGDSSESAMPRAITQVSSDKFVVLPVPDSAEPYQMEMVLALKPTRTASDMDEAAFNELEDAIVHGTLQRLLALPKQKWEDRELAAYHAKQYLSRITERRARANLTNARATLRVQIPSF